MTAVSMPGDAASERRFMADVPCRVVTKSPPCCVRALQQNAGMQIKRALVIVTSLLFPLCLSGCGGKEANEGPRVPDALPPEEAPDTSWETSETKEGPEQAEPEESAPPKSGRPELKLRHSSLIEASIDYMGAELRLGDKASLVFPRDALPEATAYHFAQRRGTPGPKRIGLNYEMAPQVTSEGDPFVLELPLPSYAKTANFALLQTTIRDGERGRGWVVVSATRIDREKGIAILETTHLPEGWV
jgi:hypothetical protein